MDSDTTNQQLSEIIAAFKRDLERLVLDSYAKGIPVEGAWEITIPVTDAPDWTVTIEKTYSEEPSPYQPGILKE